MTDMVDIRIMSRIQVCMTVQVGLIIFIFTVSVVSVVTVVMDEVSIVAQVLLQTVRHRILKLRV